MRNARVEGMTAVEETDAIVVGIVVAADLAHAGRVAQACGDTTARVGQRDDIEAGGGELIAGRRGGLAGSEQLGEAEELVVRLAGPDAGVVEAGEEGGHGEKRMIGLIDAALQSQRNHDASRRTAIQMSQDG